ncbi:MAG: Hpt domain-containing protein [Gemmatimonadetes bacterium]|nr:Hpt domain-containing protein [Gemmatimonadota bacterium]
MLELAEMFFAEVPQRLTILRDGLAQGNAAEVARVAHLLKGSAGNIGAARTAALAGRLEKAARGGQLGEGAPVFAELEHELPRFRAALDLYLATHAAR